jgi:hypothetical protein
VRRGGRWLEEKLAGNKIGKKLLEFNKRKGPYKGNAGVPTVGNRIKGARYRYTNICFKYRR